MYKLVAIDLDGTMLNKYGEVTQNTKKTIKKSGIYTFQWKYYKNDNKIYVRFTVLDYGKEINTTGNVELMDLTDVSNVSDVTVRSLWFCNIRAENGVDVYTTLPNINEPTQEPVDEPTQQPTVAPSDEPAQKEDQLDNTPKTGTVNMALIASVVGIISLAGIVALKKRNK